MFWTLILQVVDAKGDEAAAQPTTKNADASTDQPRSYAWFVFNLTWSLHKVWIKNTQNVNDYTQIIKEFFVKSVLINLKNWNKLFAYSMVTVWTSANGW